MTEKDKQQYTKYYIANKRSSNVNLTNNRGWTQILQKGKQFLLH